jgi:hypothetical protein
LLLVFALCGAVSGCSSSDDPNDPNDPNDPGGTTGQFFLRANVDGAWAAETPPSGSITGLGRLTFGGTKISGANPYGISFSLNHIAGTGTYPLGTGSTVPGGGAVVSNALTGASTWATPLTGADGSLTITTLTADRIGGTFNFTAAGVASTTGTKTATNGEFLVPLTSVLGQVLGPLPDNYGSKISATIAGASFNAAHASGTYFAANRVVTVQGSNNTRGFSISLNEVTGPGTYTLNTTRWVGTTLSVSPTVVDGWRSDQTGGSGSVTVTSLTATRMRGTFTATLGPIPNTGATGTITIANGSFDIGLNAPPE